MSTIEHLISDQLVWLAARREWATVTRCPELDHTTVPATELCPETLARFADTMAERGLDLADFVLIPVHPWRWANRIVVSCAAELAKRNLVLLGESAEDFLDRASYASAGVR